VVITTFKATGQKVLETLSLLCSSSGYFNATEHDPYLDEHKHPESSACPERLQCTLSPCISAVTLTSLPQQPLP
jgi:hypothetical protein